jgi:single-strand DNA-binding protein
MALVRVEQGSAHLASSVRWVFVQGRDGQPVSKATLTAISNTGKGSGNNRGEEATAILWTLCGKQAENAAQYLAKGSHVNVVGRVQNNNYEREGETLHAQQGPAPESGENPPASKQTTEARATKPAKGKKAAAPQAALAGVDVDGDIPL